MIDRFGTSQTAARECELGLHGVTKEAESSPAAVSAKRLEDVEKIVPEFGSRLSELEEYVLEVADRLMTRLEALEALEAPQSHYVTLAWPPGLD